MRKSTFEWVKLQTSCKYVKTHLDLKRKPQKLKFPFTTLNTCENMNYYGQKQPVSHLVHSTLSPMAKVDNPDHLFSLQPSRGEWALDLQSGWNNPSGSSAVHHWIRYIHTADGGPRSSARLPPTSPSFAYVHSRVRQKKERKKATCTLHKHLHTLYRSSCTTWSSTALPHPAPDSEMLHLCAPNFPTNKNLGSVESHADSVMNPRQDQG